ncbi:substrate-binding domain-containing protein [Streptomyces sp. NPDC051001]|uniref:LacI family DNA-binding transcriptional regulator n=1 Tax=Streptomyces sp. NPDC051001 TaxID=3155795 RepID=UPI003431F48C
MTTVSRALNGKGEISEDTVVKVRKAITEGFGLRMLTVNRGEESLSRLGLWVAAKSFDGLLVIEPEGALGAITDARHLLDLGRRRPLMVTGPDEYGCTRERLRGFVDVYAQAGIELDQRSIICSDFLFDSSRGAVAQARADGVESDAVFGHNDPSAAGVLTALHEAGLKIPRDVAVVGFDDVEPASYICPALTTVRRPMREAGRQRRLCCSTTCADRPRSPPSRTTPTSLVIRGSTSQPGPN